MRHLIARIFGLATPGELEDVRSQVFVLTQQLRKVSSMVGANTKAISDLAYASKTNSIELKKQSELVDNLAKSFSELALEIAMSFDILQTGPSRKNIGVGLPSLFEKGDDDDDLIN